MYATDSLYEQTADIHCLYLSTLELLHFMRNSIGDNDLQWNNYLFTDYLGFLFLFIFQPLSVHC